MRALLSLLLLSGVRPCFCAADTPKPVKAFILAGQSNMEGQGVVKADAKRNGGKGTLEFLVKDPATAARFHHLVERDGPHAIVTRLDDALGGAAVIA